MNLNNYPNRGKFWSKNEEKELFDEITSKMDYEDVAKKHGRSLGGIKARVLEICFNMHKKQNKSIDDLVAFTGFDRVCLEYSLHIREQKKNVKPKTQDIKTCESIPYQNRTIDSNNKNEEIVNDDIIKILHDMRNIMLDIHHTQNQILNCVNQSNTCEKNAKIKKD